MAVTTSSPNRHGAKVLSHMFRNSDEFEMHRSVIGHGSSVPRGVPSLMEMGISVDHRV